MKLPQLPQHRRLTQDPEVQRGLRQLRTVLLGPDAALRARILEHIQDHALPAVLRLLVQQLIREWRKALPVQQHVMVEVLRALAPVPVETLQLALMVNRAPAVRVDLLKLLGLVCPLGNVRVLLSLLGVQDSEQEHAHVRAAAGHALTAVSPVPVEQLDAWLDAQATHWIDRLLLTDRAARKAPAAPTVAASGTAG